MGTKRVPNCKEETMRRWLFPAILALLLVGGIATAVAVGDGWDRHHDNEITRVVGANGDETIVIHDDHPPFFFPFGIFLFPLGFLFFFALMRAIFWRGGWGRGGPWGYGGPGGGAGAGWLEEWHRRAHATGNDATASGPDAPRSE